MTNRQIPNRQSTSLLVMKRCESTCSKHKIVRSFAVTKKVLTEEWHAFRKDSRKDSSDSWQFWSRLVHSFAVEYIEYENVCHL